MKILLTLAIIALIAGGVVWWNNSAVSTLPPSELELIAEEHNELQAALDELASATTTNFSPEVATTSPTLVTTSKLAPAETAVETNADPVPTPTGMNDDERAALATQLEALQAEINARTAREATPYYEIVDPTGFINSEPFTLAELIGEKVVLLKFTTYSCHNCQATYPYVINWHNTYADEGLAVVAIHTPEFSFEKDIDNVRAAMEREGVTFPVVLDNNKDTWRAYGNRYWPRMYLIDKNGDIVYDHIGEGAYAVTEAKIQSLLADLNGG